MKLQKLLNFSTHPGELDLFDNDWEKIRGFVHDHGFDGFELLPVGDYPFEKIPKELIRGLHLRFFIFLEHIWKNDREELLKMFGNMENVQRFYGGTNRQCIVDTYKKQFELAHQLECAYVVFHPVQCNLENIYDWNFPWHWTQTMDMCAEILNEALPASRYKGLLLFENLWWPGSFTLQNARKYEYLRNRVDYEHCGIVLDTAHLLNTSGGYNRSEPAAIEYLLRRVREMSSIVDEIRTVHLTNSMSGDYIKTSRESMHPDPQADFWQQLASARRHVGQIDPHEPFTDPAIAELFEIVCPEQVVFEFTFHSLATWKEKITAQKNALERTLW